MTKSELKAVEAQVEYWRNVGALLQMNLRGFSEYDADFTDKPETWKSGVLELTRWQADRILAIAQENAELKERIARLEGKE